MKKLVSVILLVLCAAVATAQTAVTLSGGDNEFFINTTAYPVNTVALNFNDDSTYLGIIVLPNSPKVTLRPISYYKRVGGVSFADADAILAFADSFMFSSGGGGSSPTLTSTQIAYGDPSNAITSSSTLTYVKGGGLKISNTRGNTVFTLSDSTTDVPRYVVYQEADGTIVHEFLDNSGNDRVAITNHNYNSEGDDSSGAIYLYTTGSDAAIHTKPNIGSVSTRIVKGGDFAMTDDAIYYTQISLTSAQLLTLNSVPVQLVPAPGAGKYIVPIHMSIDYTFVSAAYSGSTLQTYEMADKSGPITSNTSFLNFASSTIRQLYLTGAAGGGTATYADNQPLMMWVSGSNPTTGDGTAKVNIYYKIMTR